MSNTYTDNLADGTVLTDAQLDTALTSLQLDLPNTALLTTTAAANTFLKASTPGGAATWAVTPDPITSGPREYGLNAIASASNLVISLRTDDGTVPTSSNPVYITFPSSGTTGTRQIRYSVTTARSISVTASATLGMTGTSSMSVYVYAVQTTTAASGVLLAVSSESGHGDGRFRNATAMSAAADTLGTIYASGTISLKIFTLLGQVRAARNSSGNWQTPTQVTLCHGAQTVGSQDANGIVYGSTSRATGTSVGVGGVALGTTSGNFQATSTTFITTASLAVSLTTSGRPVFVGLIPAGTSEASIAVQDNTATISTGLFQFRRGTAAIAVSRLTLQVSGASNRQIPVGSLFTIDTPAAGTYTYSLYAAISGSSTGDSVRVFNAKIFAYEL